MTRCILSDMPMKYETIGREAIMHYKPCKMFKILGYPQLPNPRPTVRIIISQIQTERVIKSSEPCIGTLSRVRSESRWIPNVNIRNIWIKKNTLDFKFHIQRKLSIQDIKIPTTIHIYITDHELSVLDLNKRNCIA